MPPELEPSDITDKEALKPATKIRRSKRVARRTFATDQTPFTKDHRQFGHILLRKDHGAELSLTPRQRYDFIRACIAYAKLNGRADIIKTQMGELEKVIREFTDAHEGLRGVESERLDVSVTDVPEVSISPDVKLVREQSGSAFPQFGTEHLIADLTIPEEPQTSGRRITAESSEDVIRLGLRILGVDEETLATNLTTTRTMKVTDREALFEAANKGEVSKDALHVKASKKVVVKSLHPTRTKTTNFPNREFN